MSLKKYVICDLDGTIADSAHRLDLLPICVGAQVETNSGLHGKITEVQDVPGMDCSVWTVYLENGEVYMWDTRRLYEACRIDWSAWEEAAVFDAPIDHTMFLIRNLRPALLRDQIGVLYLASRNEIGRKETMSWLQRQEIFYPDSDLLVMRPTQNPLKDTILKSRIIAEMMERGIQFPFALGDRPSIIAEFKKLGIPSFQVRV